MLKRIFCVVLAILIPIALFPMSAFAVDPVVFSEAETLGAVIVDLYGAYNNTSLAYQNFSDGSALTEIITLYNNYSQSASDPVTLAAIGAAAVAAGAIAVIYDAITGKGYIQLYQEQYVSSLDGFWDYTLNDLGFLRSDDGHYYWLEGQPEVAVVSVSEFPLLPVTEANYNSTSSSGLFLCNNSYNWSIYVGSSSSDVFCFLYLDSNSSYNICFVSPSSSSSGHLAISPISSFTNIQFSVNLYGSYSGAYGAFSSVSNVTSGVPIFNSLSDGLSAFDDRVNRALKIVAEPSVYIGDPLMNPEFIEYPDPSSPDYAPRPATIQTNVEWDPEWGPDPVSNPTPGVPYPITDASTLNNLVPDLWSQIVSNSVSVEAPQPDVSPDDPGLSPSEVFIPFLPVTLPSFNFSLSGIWHYVVTWVQSLGSWFSTMFTVWAALPYAMTVPVYATAVVVIVLGVYKRFFM